MNVVAHTAALTVSAHTAELRRAAAWLHAEAGARAVPADDIGRLDLCLHEALVNIIDHSGLKAEAAVRLQLLVRHGSATLLLIDGGRPYDPTRLEPRPRAATLADTEPGGLGVVMLRAQADQLDYVWREGCNYLSITVRWSAA